MGKISKLKFVALSVLFVSTAPVNASQMGTRLLGRAAATTAAVYSAWLTGATNIYSSGLSCDRRHSSEMNPEQEQNIRHYIKKICPDFGDAYLLRRRLASSDTIKIKQLSPIFRLLGSGGLTNQVTGLISFLEEVQIESPNDDKLTARFRFLVAHELCHYLYQGGLRDKVSTRVNHFNFVERIEIEADFEAMKRLDKYDPEGLRTYFFYRANLNCNGQDLAKPYLNNKEILVIWYWYKKEREKSGFNSNHFLRQYIENRDLVTKIIEEEKFLHNYKSVDGLLCRNDFNETIKLLKQEAFVESLMEEFNIPESSIEWSIISTARQMLNNESVLLENEEHFEKKLESDSLRVVDQIEQAINIEGLE